MTDDERLTGLVIRNPLRADAARFSWVAKSQRKLQPDMFGALLDLYDVTTRAAKNGDPHAIAILANVGISRFLPFNQ